MVMNGFTRALRLDELEIVSNLALRLTLSLCLLLVILSTLPVIFAL